MPVYGRPTKAALLKMTQGSCGPVRKPFQKTRKATGTSGVSVASRASATLRFKKRSVATATAEARTTESATTAMIQLREVPPLTSKLLDASWEAFAWFRAAPGGRGWKVR